ncbi:hypothetical protein V2J09_007195 [Rumex salicifolius]
MEDYATDDNEYYYEDDEDLSDYDDSFQEFDDSDPSCSNSAKRCFPKVITKESLLAAQREDLNTIMDMLSVGLHHARTLLIHFRWNVEKIFELYADSGISKLFAAAGVKVAQHHQILATASSLTCDICIDEKPGSQFTVMDCGWTEHFIVKINEGQGRRIKCMAHKCNSICDATKVESLVNARDCRLAEKFHSFLMESYVEDNNMIKWCPSVPHCGNAIRVDDFCEVECSCGLQFCFSCSSEAHSPCSCIMWELWVKKCQDESETVTWLTVNTKMCPKCHNWLCGGATGKNHTWESISGHSCGRYEESEQKAKNAKHELQRYLHYYNRYKAHMDSYKHEAKLKEKIHLKMVELEQKESIKLKDYGWVTNAVNRLFRSRWILSLSYPFAFYMFGDDLFKNEMTKEVSIMKQHLFEDQQQQLEANIEKLSMFLDEPFQSYDEDKINKVRTQILTMSTVVDNLCRNMYDCIENDLLGSLQLTTMVIAPYSSSGVEKALAIESA